MWVQVCESANFAIMYFCAHTYLVKCLQCKYGGNQKSSHTSSFQNLNIHYINIDLRKFFQQPKFYSISYKIVEIFLQAAVRQAMADQVSPQLRINLISLHRIKKQMQVWIVFDFRAKNAPHFWWQWHISAGTNTAYDVIKFS